MNGFKHFFFILKSLLIPKEYAESVHHIDLPHLYAQGYKTLFLDLDNTLLSPEEMYLTLHFEHWIEQAKSIGFQVFIVSNNSHYRRVKRICDQVNIKGLYFAMKPFSYSIRHLAKKEYINLEQSILIGDQVLTDILVGNWLNMYSVLVDPLDKKLSFLKTMQRDIELWLLKTMKSHG